MPARLSFFIQFLAVSALQHGFVCVATTPLQSTAPTPSSPNWVAVFLNSTEQVRCLQYLDDPANPYSKDVQCGHMTVEFNPRSLDKYKPLYGVRERLKILAYGHDDNDQALLVQAESINGNDTVVPVVSKNYYPHITISDKGVEPYTPVYSIVVWERMDRSSVFEIVRDSVYNLPNLVYLPNFDYFWEGDLPAINSTLYPNPAGGPYPPSAGLVQIVPYSDNYFLEGTFCINTLWNMTSGECMTESI